MLAHIANAHPEAPRPGQVPRPTRAESTPEAIEPLAAALEFAGETAKAARLRDHAAAIYLVDRCVDHGYVVRPKSDGVPLCPWCRRGKLVRWMHSLIEAGKGREINVFDVAIPSFEPAVLRKGVGRIVLKDRAAAVFDFVPTTVVGWRLFVLAMGLSQEAADKLLDYLQKVGRGFVSTETIAVDDLGHALDRKTARLSDFAGQQDLLRQYVSAKLGQQVIRPRRSSAVSVTQQFQFRLAR